MGVWSGNETNLEKEVARVTSTTYLGAGDMEDMLSTINNNGITASTNRIIVTLSNSDEDTHYDEICGYLASMSKEDILKLGVTLGLNATRLEGEDGTSLAATQLYYSSLIEKELLLVVAANLTYIVARHSIIFHK